jgi:large subunit ribosomal protein L29
VKIEEVRSKTEDELDYDLTRMKKELFDLRFKAAAETSPKSTNIRDLRRSIARIQTVLRERSRGQEKR